MVVHGGHDHGLGSIEDLAGIGANVEVASEVVHFTGSTGLEPPEQVVAPLDGLGGGDTDGDTVDYKTCVQYLRESDLLLLFAQNQPLQIPGKFYDYIAVRKRILIFTEEGATADLAKQINWGIIIDSSGPALIAEQLRDLYKQFQQGELGEATHLNLAVELRKRELTQKLMAGIP